MKKLVIASVLSMALSVGMAALPETHDSFMPCVNVVMAEQSQETMTADGYGALPGNMPLPRAKMMARRAAIMDAQRNLIEIIKGAQVDAESSMDMYLLQSDVVKTKVSGMIKGAMVVSEGLEDGGYHVVMSVPMYGVGSVADAAITAKLGDSPSAPAPVPAPSAQAVKEYAPAPQANIGGGYTGLVIDAKGSELVRTFCPVIYDVNGRAIYGVQNVDKDYAISHGVVEYAEGADNWQGIGRGTTRAGSNPLIVKIVGLQERATNKCDVIISVEEADKILIENQRSGFLNSYAVVFEK